MGRKKKHVNSKVLSIRISDEELQSIQEILATSRIKRVSDLMREAIHLFKCNLPADLKLAVATQKSPTLRS